MTSVRVAMAETKRRSTSSGDETKARIVEATLKTLKQEGIVGTSARAIARAGDFNQALIFYHFGSVDDLVVAAVAEMSRRRMENHSPRLAEVNTLSEMVQVARELHADDLAADNMTVLTQAFAGAGGKAAMGPKLYEELEPWSELVAETIERVLTVPAALGIDQRQIAQGISALFLGIELLDDLDPERAGAEALFDTLEGLSRVLELVLQMPSIAALGAVDGPTAK
jgi:AcrR family transcriptional regulator